MWKAVTNKLNSPSLMDSRSLMVGIIPIPLRVAEMVPLRVAEMVPLRVAEIVPLLVADIVPVFANEVEEKARANSAAHAMALQFFIVLLLMFFERLG
jgi:hypothetical protein